MTSVEKKIYFVDKSSMAELIQVEKKLIGKIRSASSYFLKIAVHTYSDYRERSIGVQAASISFYAIFSIFPLLAFMVYVATHVAGTGEVSTAASIVINILRDFVPGLQNWIQKGLFNIIKGTSVANWVNGLILAWASLGLFSAVQTVIYHLPKHEHHREQAHLVKFSLAITTFSLVSLLLTAVIFSELVGSAKTTPIWMREVPAALQTVLITGAKSGILLGVVSVFTSATLFRILLPFKMHYKFALVGGTLFTGLLVLTNSLYGYYMQSTNAAIQSTYGIFSSLVALIIWVHFVVKCGVYSCLYAYHLEVQHQVKNKKTINTQYHHNDHLAA